MSSNLHAAARQWASYIPVFPCSQNSKKPLPDSGSFQDATQDLAQIDRWWAENPYYNLAACPDHGGYYVLDVDGVDGIDTLELLMMTEFTPADCRARIRTPSGGKHLWFKGSRPSSVKRLYSGVDIRGIGGYVLLPPSVVDGREYAFDLS